MAFVSSHAEGILPCRNALAGLRCLDKITGLMPFTGSSPSAGSISGLRGGLVRRCASAQLNWRAEIEPELYTKDGFKLRKLLNQRNLMLPPEHPNRMVALALKELATYEMAAAGDDDKGTGKGYLSSGC